MARGRVEARITIPTGGWSVSVTITAIGTFAVTIAAGNYFPTDLLTTFKTQLDAATGADSSGWPPKRRPVVRSTRPARTSTTVSLGRRISPRGTNRTRCSTRRPRRALKSR